MSTWLTAMQFIYLITGMLYIKEKLTATLNAMYHHVQWQNKHRYCSAVLFLYSLSIVERKNKRKNCFNNKPFAK